MSGSRGYQSPPPPHPLKSQNIGFHSNTSPDLKKSQSYQASIQFWAVIGMVAKRHLNGVSLAGRWWPALSGIWLDYLTPLKRSKNVIIFVPPLT